MTGVAPPFNGRLRMPRGGEAPGQFFFDFELVHCSTRDSPAHHYFSIFTLNG